MGKRDDALNSVAQLLTDQFDNGWQEGVKEAIEMLRSDEMYYEVADAKQSRAIVLQEAASFLEKEVLSRG